MNLTLVIFMCERLFLTPTIHMSDKKYFQKFLINTMIKSLISSYIFYNSGKRKSSMWSHVKINTLLISLHYRAIRGRKSFGYTGSPISDCDKVKTSPWNIGLKCQNKTSGPFLDVDIYENVKQISLSQMALYIWSNLFSIYSSF